MKFHDNGTTSEPGESAATLPTRASAAWVAVGVALALMILLIVFILQNLGRVSVHYLGITAHLPLGVGLLISAVAGGVVVGVAGLARVTELRRGRRGNQP